MNKEKKKEREKTRSLILLIMLIALPVHLYMKDFAISSTIGITIVAFIVFAMSLHIFSLALLILPVYAFWDGGILAGVICLAFVVIMIGSEKKVEKEQEEPVVSVKVKVANTPKIKVGVKDRHRMEL